MRPLSWIDFESRYMAFGLVGTFGVCLWGLTRLFELEFEWWLWLVGCALSTVVFGVLRRREGWSTIPFVRGLAIALIVCIVCPSVIPRATPLVTGLALMLYAGVVGVIGRRVLSFR